MKMLAGFALAVLLALMPEALAAENTASRLEEIQQERIRLQAVREKLESQLGALGKELQQLDKELVVARRASNKANRNVAEAKSGLSELNAQKGKLEQRVKDLRERMQAQVASAYQSAGSDTLLALIVQGTPVYDMPHRRYLLASIMQAQERDRKAYLENLAELLEVVAKAEAKLDELKKLQKVQQAEKQVLQKRVNAKKELWRKIKRDESLRKQRDDALAKQEKALVDLLKGLGAGLADTDFSVVRQSLRQRKGKISWPLDGKIVASYRSQIAPGRPRLAGVQLAPRRDDARQVTAIGPGRVRFADWFGGYGLMMIVDHGDGMMSVYAHNNALFKQLGDWVEDREILAEAGSTGWVERVRLYFELRDAGKTVDPKKWCRR